MCNPVFSGEEYVDSDKNFDDVEPMPSVQENPFSFSIAVREEYDDNINTSETNRQDAFKTWLTPSIVYTAPWEDAFFSMGLTYSAIFFLDTPDERIEQQVNFLLSFNKTFNDRVNLDIRNRFRLAQDPDALEDLTVFEVDGTYWINSTSVQLGIEWTPLLGTTTLATFDYYNYTENSLGTVNDRISYSVRQDFRFLIWPTVTWVFGGSFRNTHYLEGLDRDFTNYYLDTGVDWQALPNLVMGFRGGVILTDSTFEEGVLNPGGSAYVNWEIGARSSLNFRFAQDVSPTDLGFEGAQVSSTFSLTFTYEITPRLTSYVTGVARIGEFDDFLSPTATGVGDFNEDIGSVSLGFNYFIDATWSANAGYTYSTRISPLPGREYDRNRVYLGVSASF